MNALLAARADVNSRDHYGRTALMETALMGREDCVRALIAAHADVSARDKGGWTSLSLTKSPAVAALLRSAGEKR